MLPCAHLRCKRSACFGVLTNPAFSAAVCVGDAMATFFRSAVLVGSLALALSLPTSAVTRFDTAEIALRSTAFYSASQGNPNPFDLVLSADVTSPSGRRFVVDGFFDGDGVGGLVGNVFKFRVYGTA